ncbi:hypothetical protein D9M71_670790 [compost metagenome]
MHVEFGDHQANGGTGDQQRQRLFATVGGDAGDALGDQFVGQGIAPRLVVVHQQDAGRRVGYAHDFIKRLQFRFAQQITVTHGVVLERSLPGRPNARH